MVRTSPRIVVTGLAALVGACAAATPGYVPDGTKKSPVERMKAFDSGDVGANGRYVPSAAERELPCGKLRGSMALIVTRLKAAQKPEASTISATAQSAMTSVRGRSLILAPTEEAKRERARLDAYNTILVEKNCPAMDIEAELGSLSPKAVQPAAAAKK